MVQIGIRGAQNFDEGWRYCEEMGFTVIWCEDVHREGVDAAVARAREIVGDAPTYVSRSVLGMCTMVFTFGDFLRGLSSEKF